MSEPGKRPMQIPKSAPAPRCLFSSDALAVGLLWMWEHTEGELLRQPLAA